MKESWPDAACACTCMCVSGHVRPYVWEGEPGATCCQGRRQGRTQAPAQSQLQFTLLVPLSFWDHTQPKDSQGQAWACGQQGAPTLCRQGQRCPTTAPGSSVLGGQQWPRCCGELCPVGWGPLSSLGATPAQGQWAAVRGPSTAGSKMGTAGPGAAAWLLAQPEPAHWGRTHFPPIPLVSLTPDPQPCLCPSLLGSLPLPHKQSPAEGGTLVPIAHHALECAWAASRLHSLEWGWGV